MSMPDPDGTQAQILLKLGEITTQLAVMSEKLSALPDHENRLRSLERFRWQLVGLWLAGTAASGVAGWLIATIRK